MKRYPWGMPAWLFWVIAVLAASLVGQVPFVGPVLTGAALIAALVWFFGFVKPEADRRYRAYMPVPVTGAEDLVLDRLEVVGESHYLLGISRAVGIAGRALTAVISWEPRNPHSKARTALRVDLVAGDERITCGYVPDGLSHQLLPVVRANAERGVETTLPATVFGGTAGKPNYGVVLGSGAARRTGPRFS